MSDLHAAAPCHGSEGISRRAVLGGAAVGVGLLVLNGCSSRREQSPLVTHGTVPIGRARDYSAGTVSNKYMARYGIAISNDGGTITAIRPKCTHLGCIAPWDPAANEFVCPCHGSRYDIEGRPTQGPAKKYLARVDVETSAEGDLSVDLDQLYALEPPIPPDR